MSSGLYLGVMLGVIALVVAVSVPSLFFKRCPRCGKKNSLDARVCTKCSAPFPEDDPN